MKRLYTLLTIILTLSLSTLSAKSLSNKVDLELYGFIRTDYYYDSRATASAINDLFFLYPLDVEEDALGEDLNATSDSGLLAVASRLGLDVGGVRLGSASVTAKIEADFAGFSTNNYILRLRQAYFNLKWDGGSYLLLGQTWHPMFGTVFPRMANLSTGAPFQPFSRAPQVRYEHRLKGWNFIAAAIYQLQNTSDGPDGFTNQYQRNSSIPELYLGFDYYCDRWQFGGGADLLNISPRTQSTMASGDTYKVNESLTSLSAEFHAQYKSEKLFVAMKGIYASAMESTCMVSGYGVTSISSETGEQSYTPLNNATAWINVLYGTKWSPYIFVGYTKNLGSTEPLVSSDLIYGRGLGIDQLVGVNVGLSYNLSSFSASLEYSNTIAWYGDIDLATGRVDATHHVANNRVILTLIYRF